MIRTRERSPALLILAGIALAYVSLTSLHAIGVAHGDTGSAAPAVAHVTVEEVPPTMRAVVTPIATDPIAVIGVVLGGIALLLAGAERVLGVIAPRTKTTIDDTVLADIREALAFIRGLPGVPPAASSTTVNVATPPRNPQAGRASLIVMALLALGPAAVLTTQVSCSSWQEVKADVVAVEHGAVTCGKADVPAIKALGYQLGIEAAASLLTGHGIPWAQLRSEAEAGAKEQGIAVGSCAFGQLIADLAKLLPAPNTPTVMARADDGRAELATLKAHLGVTSISLASGQAL